jgi:hypothetical protein
MQEQTEIIPDRNDSRLAVLGRNADSSTALRFGRNDKSWLHGRELAARVLAARED